MLVPNPAYLFLSKSHEEALAHLTYAVTQGDGFVEITGEVGTGKTTLCRVFLEKLDDTIEAAYIFNPMLNAVQLMKAINSEFGIRSDLDNTKDLIDCLNDFLIQKKAEGKKVIIVVDEAQNLSLEVLEQLRLLSNLETTTSKLLQIILVGQPELREKLDSRELRQLAQRITLSCHLTPMTYEETRDYIQHRIQVASLKTGPKFTRGAVKTIYSFSAGIPRLINIVSDRSLLIAYGLNQTKITGSVTKAAVRELTTRADVKRKIFHEKKTRVVLLFLLCISLLGYILYNPLEFNIFKFWMPSSTDVTNSTIIEKRPETKLPQIKQADPIASQPQNQTSPKPLSETQVTNVEPKPINESLTDQNQVVQQPKKIQLLDFIANMDAESSRASATVAIFNLWHLETYKEVDIGTIIPDNYFSLSASMNGFMIHRIDNYDLDLILKLQLPAIFEFKLPGSKFGYLTLSNIQSDQLIFRSGKDANVIQADLSQLRKYWSGTAYIFWKNFYHYIGTIPKDSTPEAILAVKMQLREIGYKDIPLNATYDDQTRQAIETIQKKNKIVADGLIGPLTKIVLYNETKSLNIPNILNPLKPQVEAIP